MAKGMEDIFLEDRYMTGRTIKKTQKKIISVQKQKDLAFKFLHDLKK